MGSGSMLSSTGAFLHPNKVHIGNVPNSAFMSKEVLPYLQDANTNATLVSSSGPIGLYTVPPAAVQGRLRAHCLHHCQQQRQQRQRARLRKHRAGPGPPITCDITATAQGVKKQVQGKVALEKVPVRCSPYSPICRFDMRQVGGRPAGREGHGLHQLGGSGSVDVGMKDFLREVKMPTKEVCAV